MTTWSVSFVGAAATDITADQLAALATGVQAAGAEWDRYLVPNDVTLSVRITFRYLDSIANGTSVALEYVGTTPGSVDIFQQGTLEELRTGVDPNGTAPDIDIGISTGFLANFFLDPNPYARSAPVPPDASDLQSVLLHELGHALGYNGFSLFDIRSLPTATSISTYEADIQLFDDQPYYTGTNAVSVYGDLVPLSTSLTNSAAHLGNPAGEIGDDLIADLMYQYNFAGTRRTISALNVAMLEDLGAPIRQPSAGDDVLYGFDAVDPALARIVPAPIAEYLRGADRLDGAAGNDTLFGLSGDDTLSGGSGSDYLDGGADRDKLYGGDGADTILGGTGSDVLVGGPGDDSLTGGPGADIFVLALGVGTEEILDFGSGGDKLGLDGLLFADLLVQRQGVDTAVYANGELLALVIGVEPASIREQDVTYTFNPLSSDDFRARPTDATAPPPRDLSSVRDYDGNDLGSADQWTFIGSADVQNDGDLEHVYVNPAIGRWATVGPDAQGLIDFADHGRGGDTRVVGIYIDPEVEAGRTERFSEFDSQQRFQNDLRIDNLEIIDAFDFDADGFQEVYFRVKDDTAYLRALMHADGNIQYANYQNSQQVQDYLADAGYDQDVIDTILV